MWLFFCECFISLRLFIAWMLLLHTDGECNSIFIYHLGFFMGKKFISHSDASDVFRWQPWGSPSSLTLLTHSLNSNIYGITPKTHGTSASRISPRLKWMGVVEGNVGILHRWRRLFTVVLQHPANLTSCLKRKYVKVHNQIMTLKVCVYSHWFQLRDSAISTKFSCVSTSSSSNFVHSQWSAKELFPFPPQKPPDCPRNPSKLNTHKQHTLYIIAYILFCIQYSITIYNFEEVWSRSIVPSFLKSWTADCFPVVGLDVQTNTATQTCNDKPLHWCSMKNKKAKDKMVWTLPVAM